MTTTIGTRAQAKTRQGGLKGLAGVLTFVCLVLFLLAIEQKQAVDAWAAVRDGAGPAVTRVFHWAADGASDGIEGLKTAAARPDAPRAADPVAAVLAGAFRPADDVTRDSVGTATFTGAVIQLEGGETLHTRPLSIAAGSDAFNSLRRTFAAELDARDDAQIELRAVVPAKGAQTTPASPLCGGATPGAVAVLHRGDRVEVMLFRERTIIGPDAPADALCGVWRFRA